MYERIEKLRKNKGLTVRKVEEDNGFSNGSLKKISPKTECGRILSLSKYFGVSMEYLITGQTGSGTSLTTKKSLTGLYPRKAHIVKNVC